MTSYYTSPQLGTIVAPTGSHTEYGSAMQYPSETYAQLQMQIHSSIHHSLRSQALQAQLETAKEHALLHSLRAAAAGDQIGVPRSTTLSSENFNPMRFLAAQEQREDPVVKATQRSQFFKTRYCPHYFSRVGFCKRGADCNYAHSEDELRPSVNLTKTKICQNYNAGACPKSAFECPFAHGIQELRATPSFYKSQLCKFWSTGHCPAGLMCRHAHGEEDRIKKTSQVSMEDGVSSHSYMNSLYERPENRHLTAPVHASPPQYSSELLNYLPRSDSLPEDIARALDSPDSWLQAAGSLETATSLHSGLPSSLNSPNALALLKETIARRASPSPTPSRLPAEDSLTGRIGSQVAAANASDLASLFLRLARVSGQEGDDLALDFSRVLEEAGHADRPLEQLVARLQV